MLYIMSTIFSRALSVINKINVVISSIMAVSGVYPTTALVLLIVRDTDVTAVVDEQGWTLKKPLEARMTSSVLDNLPDPVVIVKQLDEGGKIKKESLFLSPTENPRRYGNLLKKYGKSKLLAAQEFFLGIPSKTTKQSQQPKTIKQ